MTISGTGFVVCAVCGLVAVRLEHLLGVAVVGADEADAPCRPTASTTRPRQASTVSTARTTAGITPVCPTMSGFAKFTIAKR